MSPNASNEHVHVDAIVLAGGSTAADDPLYPVLGDSPKSLLPLHGQVMVQYVLNALQASAGIDRLAVIGLNAQAGAIDIRNGVFLADQGGIVQNALAGIRYMAADDDPDHLILICTGDAPLITVDTVEAVLSACAPFDADFYYPVVTKQAMEAAFPGARRTYGRLREGELTGGNMVLVKAAIASSNVDLWESLTEARKHPLRMARLIGPFILIKALLRRLSVLDVIQRAEKQLGISAHAVFIDRAEIAMDIDKPHQIDLVLPHLAATEEAP